MDQRDRVVADPRGPGELSLGTAPDSWGGWFPNDPKQVPWHQFLDEAAAAGYTAVELGPYGYLPTRPEQLRDELGKRGLTLSGATAGTDSPTARRRCRTHSQISADRRPAARDGRALPDHPAGHVHRSVYRASSPNRPSSRRSVAAARRRPHELGRILGEESGVRQMFHPHADAHVDGNASIDRFLQLTDPTHVSLCLDTGHVAYVGGDNHAIVADHPDRIGYIHLKSVDPQVVTRKSSPGSGPRRSPSPTPSSLAPWSSPTPANRTCPSCWPNSTPSASRCGRSSSTTCTPTPPASPSGRHQHLHHYRNRRLHQAYC